MVTDYLYIDWTNRTNQLEQASENIGILAFWVKKEELGKASKTKDILSCAVEWRGKRKFKQA